MPRSRHNTVIRVIHCIVGLAAKAVLGMKVKLVEVEGIKFMNKA